MSYHKLNFHALYNYLMDKGFWIREKRLLIADIYNCYICIQITTNENIIHWVEPRNATMKDICKATTYLEEIIKEIKNV